MEDTCAILTRYRKTISFQLPAGYFCASDEIIFCNKDALNKFVCRAQLLHRKKGDLIQMSVFFIYYALKNVWNSVRFQSYFWQQFFYNTFCSKKKKIWWFHHYITVVRFKELSFYLEWKQIFELFGSSLYSFKESQLKWVMTMRANMQTMLMSFDIS